MNKLSQDTFVDGFDPSQVKVEKVEKKSKTRAKKTSTPQLRDELIRRAGERSPDAPLVYIRESDWEKVRSWSTSPTYKEVDGFKNLVPRIVKAVQPAIYQKDFTVDPYTVTYVPMPKLNISACDCGVFTVKFIECIALGLDLSLVNDENIKEARLRILWDLWEAANDPELVEKMALYKPPECLSSTITEIL
ncbi:unnamed protein product [Eruca vesicaria subsp. sativa]|uniref:Ubiquitin-like protease family profile domain-containing protein n=1 Tax=Eruca vesicaria subsp. sativa TaxID=29727 RepID=A0ABC8M2G3_ERUVS|nr:unnamed protein product [Eruca vesicaria subsp. sativa]